MAPYYTAGVASSIFSVVSTDFYNESITVTMDIDDPATTSEIIQFNTGDIILTHRIDTECEDDPNEKLFSNIALESGIPDISVTVPRTTITINDSLQRDCSKCYENFEPVNRF